MYFTDKFIVLNFCCIENITKVGGSIQIYICFLKQKFLHIKNCVTTAYIEWSDIYRIIFLWKYTDR